MQSHKIKQFSTIIYSQDKVVHGYSIRGLTGRPPVGVDKANPLLLSILAQVNGPAKAVAPFSLTGQPQCIGGREVGGFWGQYVHSALPYCEA